MNMRKAVAAAFGTALLAAGTGVATHSAHALLSTNSTGKAVNKNAATGGDATASVSGSASVDASQTLTSAAGAHQHTKGIRQNVHHKATGGSANGTNHGSAKSGSQSFRIK